MFIPELKTEIIDPEANVRFIQRFLSREMQENTTRPFYEKTIFLYPELKKIADIPDEKEREMFIREAVLKRLTDNGAEMMSRVRHFREVFDTFIYDFIDAQCRLFHYEWKESEPLISCNVGYLPFYPRGTEEKCFYVSYQDEERVFSGAVHEINHMIFHEKWKEMYGSLMKEEAWPDPLWYLEEIIVDPTLNDERVKRYTLYENKAYPQFYLPGKDGGPGIMDRVKACYRKHGDAIEEFLSEAYEIVRKEYGTSGID